MEYESIVPTTPATMNHCNGEKHEAQEALNNNINDGKRPSLLSPQLASYSPVSIMEIHERVKKMMADGQTVYHFGFGQSPFPIMPCAVKALVEHAAETAYLPVAGLPELRSQICESHSKLDGVKHFQAEDIIVGPGSKELIFLLLYVFNGDVLVVSPSWTTYKPMAILAGKNVIHVNTKIEGNWKVTPEELEKTILQNSDNPNRLLILCNPCNPTGTSYTEEELEALSVVLRKYKMIVLSDEIYARLLFNGKNISMAKFYPEGTIVSGGLSKWASCGGWRLGYHIYPSQLEILHKAACSAASHTYSCAPAPVQYAAVKLYSEEEECQKYLFHCRRILASIARFCHKELTSVGVKVVMPTGAYCIFPDFGLLKPVLKARGITTCEEMCQALFEEAKVAVIPGHALFRPNSEFTVRICYVNFDGSKALARSTEVGPDEDLTESFLQEYCLPVVEGIQAIKNWVLEQKKSL